MNDFIRTLRHFSEPPDALAIIDEAGATTWGQLLDRVDHYCGQWSSLAGHRVGLMLSAKADAIARLAALDALQADAFLLDSESAADFCHELSLRYGWHDQIGPDAQVTSLRGEVDRVVEPGVGGITIATSGTEGPPKVVRHTWRSLLAPVRRGPHARGARWMLAFRPQLYAGLQVIAQALANGGTLVMPPLAATPAEIGAFLATAGVTHASATPAYWRRLVLFCEPAELSRISLRQLTLGGEAVDQSLLDQLRTIFPHARITHIYATTELGRCFSVTDGRAGFPVAWLGPQALPDVELDVRDDELWVRSTHSGTVLPFDTSQPVAGVAAEPRETAGTQPGAWYPTGDLVSIEGDRVHFAGRRGDMINVGGNKVQPLRVEAVIREVPGVRDVVVFGRKSSIAGELVACQIVTQDGVAFETIRGAIQQECSRRLSRAENPRWIECVPRIAMTAAGKRQRGIQPEDPP